MNQEDEKAAVDTLVKYYRKTKKSLDVHSIFEDYELICEEMEKTSSLVNSNNRTRIIVKN